MRELEGGDVNKIRVWDGDGSSEAILTSVTTLQAGIWYYVAFTWSPSGRKLYVNGVLEASNTRGNSLGFATLAKLGSWLDRGYLNGFIDDLRISNRARTDAEILAAYQSGQPLPVDEWITYLLRFDDNLNYGQGGYYISPEYDVSSVNKAARGKVYWQEDADGIQRIVYAKLDNQADWTQVTNGGLLPISAGDVLTNRKLQLKVKMLKVI
ncbi:MAG TPA: LamG domain-containing protein [Thermoanaerobacterales bacterium]|nr:LamG domain-containing protein [Thermoanaerobacterales bacterium]